MRAAFEHHDALAHQIAGIGRPRLAVAIDHLRGDFQIGMRETRLQFALGRLDQAGGTEYRTARFVHLVEKIVQIVSRFYLQFDAQVLGKALHQLVFEAGFTVAILEISRRAVASDHPQYAVLLDSLQCGGFFHTGAEHQEESGCDEPFGATWAEIWFEEHRCSIRKAHRAPYLDSEACV